MFLARGTVLWSASRHPKCAVSYSTTSTALLFSSMHTPYKRIYSRQLACWARRYQPCKSCFDVYRAYGVYLHIPHSSGQILVGGELVAFHHWPSSELLPNDHFRRTHLLPVPLTLLSTSYIPQVSTSGAYQNASVIMLGFPQDVVSLFHLP